ncbi:MULTISPECIES: MarR family winged helix-turn-helix transcriptional regulator [Listeria]|uniref:MarR family winged helix-turn-helix transcriptional regulator n=1 Tax=Listeria TaxID=1637 RepID=UPI000B59079B|nr:MULTISPECIES: MarR family transcriptional regulator [Listeria]
MDQISEIRRFNRFYASILGKLDQKIYHNPYPLTEVRVLQQIDFENGKTASEIGDAIGVDRGYMSRIVKRFELSGLIQKQQLAGDKRHFALFITEKGQAEIEKFVALANLALSEMTQKLTDQEMRDLVEAMSVIEKLLSKEELI